MHDPKTIDAFTNARLECAPDPQKTCKRYEIIFPDGEIPEELKIAAQNTDKAKEIGAMFIPIPDEHIIPHLKIYDENTADIALNVTFPGKGVLYTLEVPLHPVELHLFDKGIEKADKKKEKYDLTQE